MARRSKAAPEPFDRELAELPSDLRWRRVFSAKLSRM